MFTGLIQHVGRVAAIESPTPPSRRLSIDTAGWSHTPAVGDSIAINGCCLTVAEPPSDGVLTFDAVAETLAKTSIGSLEPGSRVNLEHAMRAGDFFGGHFVQGHVDGVGTVACVQTGEDWRLRIAPPAELIRFATPKGSITIEGVSLTIAELDPDDRGGGWVEIALIPTTLEHTTLKDLAVGDPVNLEMDMLIKGLVHVAANYGLERLSQIAAEPNA